MNFKSLLEGDPPARILLVGNGGLLAALFLGLFRLAKIGQGCRIGSAILARRIGEETALLIGAVLLGARGAIGGQLLLVRKRPAIGAGGGERRAVVRLVLVLVRFGDEAQRQRFLPKLTSMEWLASYCLTEPGSGSDAAALKTRAVRDGSHYVLNGTKQFISGAGDSDLYIVMARTGEDGPKGISTFVVPKDAPGLTFGANERKMGWHMQSTRQVIFQDCRIAAENLLSGEGAGFSIAMAGLDGGRLNIAACSLGGAQSALDKALAYTAERKAFGKKIDQFQALQFRLADMETELQAARIFLYAAASKLDARAPDASKWSAMAKRFVTDTGFEVANGALQLFGGYGYLHDYGMEKLVRDLRVHQILEGTNEIMRVIVARNLIGR